jgi:hypothetical protein
MGVRVNQLFAFLVVDKDGDEGVPGMRIGPVHLALMGADMARVESLRAIAAQAPELKGLRITIARFGDREDIGTIDRTGDGLLELGDAAKDEAALSAITAATDDRERSALIREYWRDSRRSNRTPRALAYLHLGILSGMVDRLLNAGETEPDGV